jgi:dihydroorotase
LRVAGGRVVTPAGIREVDVAVDDQGRIAALEPWSGGGDIDARGMLVLPGAVDSHVHGRDPGFPEKEDFASLTVAAAAGGVTTVLDMPNTVPAVSTGQLLDAKRQWVEPRAAVDFGLWGMLRQSSTEDDVRSLAGAGACGIKVYLGYAVRKPDAQVLYTPAAVDPDLEPPASYGTVARLGSVLADAGLPVAAHAEDPSVLRASAVRVETYPDLLASRPDAAESVAVAAMGALSRQYGFRLHVVHLASAAGLRAVLAWRSAGAALSLEVTPNHLWLTDADFGRLGPVMKMFPLIRTAADRDALRSALLDGTIDNVATDHAPHSDDDKLHHPLATAHAGSPGVQTLLVSVLQLAGAKAAARFCAATPAALFGLQSKGTIEIGRDADLAIVEPGAPTVVEPALMLSRQRHSALNGLTFDHAVRATLLRGEPPAPGRGRWLAPARLRQP